MNLMKDELEILTILDEAQTGELVTVTNLSKETELKPSRISAILLKLERNGYIEQVTPTRYRKNIPFIETA